MKLIYIQRKIDQVMNSLDSIDFLDIKSLKTRKENQKKINTAYDLLDKFRDEIICERAKKYIEKQKGK